MAGSGVTPPHDESAGNQGPQACDLTQGCKMLKPLIPAIVSAILFVGCKGNDGPSATYEAYYKKAAAGISAFEEDAQFYSARKRAEVEQKIPAMMQSMGKSREDVVALYLAMSKAVAQCKKITLDREEVSGTLATLTYRQEDTCGNKPSGPEFQKVRLLNENGWKIDHVEVAL